MTHTIEDTIYHILHHCTWLRSNGTSPGATPGPPGERILGRPILRQDYTTSATARYIMVYT